MNSGYFGWWSNHIDSSRFNNDYYQSLLFKGWRPDTALFGNDAKNQVRRGWHSYCCCRRRPCCCFHYY